MNMEEYTEFTRTTDRYTDMLGVVLGLVAEAGEVASVWERALREDEEIDVDAALDELGDVLYYVARIADWLDADIYEVAKRNRSKLRDRARKGKILKKDRYLE